MKILFYDWSRLEKLIDDWEDSDHWPTVGEQFMIEPSRRIVVRVEHHGKDCIKVFGKLI